MSNETRRVAVIGIDGAGKSTVVRRFIELAPVSAEQVRVMTCPRYHETPDAPLHHTSLALDCFTREADRRESFELKAASLYLQMTLFGPVEEFLQSTFEPRVLLCERHALLSTLAYGPFYRARVKKQLDAEGLASLIEAMEAEMPGAWAAVERWHRLLQRRLGTEVAMEELALEVRDLLASPPAELLEALSERYRTTLPDAVILLDLPGEVAQSRIAGRADEVMELHEQAAILEELRLSYLDVLDTLQELKPELQAEVIDVSKGGGIDDTLEAVVGHLGLR